MDLSCLNHTNSQPAPEDIQMVAYEWQWNKEADTKYDGLDRMSILSGQAEWNIELVVQLVNWTIQLWMMQSTMSPIMPSIFAHQAEDHTWNHGVPSWHRLIWVWNWQVQQMNGIVETNDEWKLKKKCEQSVIRRRIAVSYMQSMMRQIVPSHSYFRAMLRSCVCAVSLT